MYPILLKLEDKPCLVVGGGKVAEKKTISLLESGARVTIISPDLTAHLAHLVSGGKVEYRKRSFEKGDTRGFFLIVSAADNRECNDTVYKEAEENGSLVNCVDDPESCSFYTPALLERGSLKITVSTEGKLPLLAGRVKSFLAALIPEDTGSRIEELGALRRRIISEAGGDREMKAKRIYENLLPLIDEMMKEWQDCPDARERES